MRGVDHLAETLTLLRKPAANNEAGMAERITAPVASNISLSFCLRSCLHARLFCFEFMCHLTCSAQAAIKTTCNKHFCAYHIHPYSAAHSRPFSFSCGANLPIDRIALGGTSHLCVGG